MIVLTRVERARTAAKLWGHQYGMFTSTQKQHGLLHDKRSPRAIYDALIALGRNPTPEQVNEVIGNDSWTTVKCDEPTCSVAREEDKLESVVVLGSDHNSISLCADCLIRAASIISKEPQ